MVQQQQDKKPARLLPSPWLSRPDLVRQYGQGQETDRPDPHSG